MFLWQVLYCQANTILCYFDVRFDFWWAGKAGICFCSAFQSSACRDLQNWPMSNYNQVGTKVKFWCFPCGQPCTWWLVIISLSGMIKLWKLYWCVIKLGWELFSQNTIFFIFYSQRKHYFFFILRKKI